MRMHIHVYVYTDFHVCKKILSEGLGLPSETSRASWRGFSYVFICTDRVLCVQLAAVAGHECV